MCLLFNTLSRFVITLLPRSSHLLISWLQSPSTVITLIKKRKRKKIFFLKKDSVQLRESLLDDQRNRPGKGKEKTVLLQIEPQPRQAPDTTAAPTGPPKPQLNVSRSKQWGSHWSHCPRCSCKPGRPLCQAALLSGLLLGTISSQPPVRGAGIWSARSMPGTHPCHSCKEGWQSKHLAFWFLRWETDAALCPTLRPGKAGEHQKVG